MKTKIKVRFRAVGLAALGLAILGPSSALAQIGGNIPPPTSDPFVFSPNRPKLVILLHGVTQKPHENREAMIGTPGHARYYWGFDFIKNLQGRGTEEEMRVIQPELYNFRMEPHIDNADWNPGSHVPQGINAPISFPASSTDLLPTGIETNGLLIKDYIKRYTNHPMESAMVMVPFRDGSKHLMPQLGDTIDQIYWSYVLSFGSLDPSKKPQIYMVTHSFGGIIARGILAAPTGADLFGNKLSPSQIERAKYIRDRVVLVNTIAGPHRGAFIGDFASDLSDWITLNGPNICYAVFQVINAVAWGEFSEEFVQQKTASFIDTAVDGISGKRDCLQDLMRVDEYNSGILQPTTAKRSNGTYVPIYTMAGRNPGGMVYDKSRSVFHLGGGTYNPISSIDIAMSGERYATEALALHINDAMLHHFRYGREGLRPWGTAWIPEGDKVASPFASPIIVDPKTLESGITITPKDVSWLGEKFLKGQPYQMFKSDGEYDSDGFLGWDSAQAIGLGTPNFYRLYNAAAYGDYLPWDIDNHGSMMFNPGTAAWIHNELVRVAGPKVTTSPARRSVWNTLTSDYQTTPSKNIKIKVLEIHDVANDIDTWPNGDADFSIRVRAGHAEWTWNCANNTRTVTNVPEFALTNYPSTVIPIKIDVWERDTHDPVSSPDDLCMVGREKAKSSLFLYYDTRTNQILGDHRAAGGDTMLVHPRWDSYNRVFLKLRITQS